MAVAAALVLVVAPLLSLVPLLAVVVVPLLLVPVPIVVLLPRWPALVLVYRATVWARGSTMESGRPSKPGKPSRGLSGIVLGGIPFG